MFHGLESLAKSFSRDPALESAAGIRQKTLTNKRQTFPKEKRGDSGFLPKEGWREKKDTKHRLGTLGNGLGSAWKRTKALPGAHS